MKECTECGSSILFGGERAGDSIFCGPQCRDHNLAKTRIREARVRVRETKVEYDLALDNLRKAPGDPTLKQKALEAGRTYASWTRVLSGSGSGVTLFDEVALSNDIQAACAAVGAPTAPLQPTTLTVEQRLERLKSLHDRSLISDEEFRIKREQILGEL